MTAEPSWRRGRDLPVDELPACGLFTANRGACLFGNLWFHCAMSKGKKKFQKSGDPQTTNFDEAMRRGFKVNPDMRKRAQAVRKKSR